MNYQVIIDGHTFLGGNTYAFFLIVFIVVMIMIGIGLMVRRKLRENDVLKYEFITIFAHKFRTPLTHVKWLIENLLGTATETSTKEDLTDMQQSTNHLIAMTGTLIELTDADNESASAYKLEPVSLCTLTKDAAAHLKTIFHEKNIFLAVTCPPEDIIVNVDKPRMEFVLQTILENSHTYTPPGRKVEVTVGIDGKKAVVAVADNGIGIEGKDLPHVFSKFFRAPNAQATDTEGFGIGLFFANSIVKRHRGKIEVFSEGKDRGTTFRILLPKK